ncbi:hypothetical protein VP01_1905g3 [Puccinia sorghi]|uniref:Uncharacterized protein n=1 Tax=Puccinia sorghi TaxID=27349 RepID=A0A0L6VCP7_9BASI|nr:hypothetical protein VP01_1905g3 [Puccinia sorghi]
MRAQHSQINCKQAFWSLTFCEGLLSKNLCFNHKPILRIIPQSQPFLTSRNEMDKNNKIKIILLLILRGACKQGLFRSLSKLSCYECRGLWVGMAAPGPRKIFIFLFLFFWPIWCSSASINLPDGEGMLLERCFAPKLHQPDSCALVHPSNCLSPARFQKTSHNKERELGVGKSEVQTSWRNIDLPDKHLSVQDLIIIVDRNRTKIQLISRTFSPAGNCHHRFVDFLHLSDFSTGGRQQRAQFLTQEVGEIDQLYNQVIWYGTGWDMVDMGEEKNRETAKEKRLHNRLLECGWMMTNKRKVATDRNGTNVTGLPKAGQRAR